MIGFVMVGTNNLDKATKFYDTLLNTIELQRVVTNEKYAGYASKEKPDEGVVIACGEGARKDSGELIAMAVSNGDKILFGKWSGTEVTVDGEELLIMIESDILVVLS